MYTEMPANTIKLPDQRWIFVWMAALCPCVAKSCQESESVTS